MVSNELGTSTYFSKHCINVKNVNRNSQCRYFTNTVFSYMYVVYVFLWTELFQREMEHWFLFYDYFALQIHAGMFVIFLVVTEYS